jgi:uncharacterized protein
MHWKDLVSQFACPACKAPLTLNSTQDSLKCTACKRVYPVRDDIPILLIDAASIEE